MMVKIFIDQLKGTKIIINIFRKDKINGLTLQAMGYRSSSYSMVILDPIRRNPPSVFTSSLNIRLYNFQDYQPKEQKAKKLFGSTTRTLTTQNK